MFKLVIYNYLLIYSSLLFIIFYVKCILSNNYSNTYYRYLNSIKHKLYIYVSSYNNCNNYSSTPLYCGHKIEGYKKQKKGFHPHDVLVNITVHELIKSVDKIVCNNKELIVGVVSAPQHFMERLSLREGYKRYNSLSLYFFTGLSNITSVNELLKDENALYKDMIIYNYISHYFNSSLMFVLEIKWINENCKGYKYFIYHTTDVYFNYNLFYKMYIAKPYKYHLIGQILKKNRVLRSNKSRFYVPYTIYNSTHYPPQPNGPLVAFSLETIKKLVNNVNNIKMSFWMDDVYLSFLIKESKIKVTNMKNVISLYPVQIKKLPNLSYIISHIIYIHSLAPGAILYLLKKSSVSI